MSLEKFVGEFAQNIAAQTDCILRGDARAGNKHAEKALAAFMALREKGDAGRDALAALFSHARIDVRITAAFTRPPKPQRFWKMQQRARV
ncbi:hypothetical protein [Corallococcus coralloides]|uniref:hypothetical protein n=1 Tax=Corallococcus coralloides TaxID=184914 RepID=UPI00307A457E